MLAEISLNIIDIARNSVRARASLIEISLAIDSEKQTLELTISDDGCGMSEEQLAGVTDPFFTSRKTRKVGLGIPFLKQAAEASGGEFSIKSEPGVGTSVVALFHTDHIDCMPLGDINDSIAMLVTSRDTESGRELDYIYTYSVDDRTFKLDTREIREILGGVPLYNSEVSAFIRTFLDENKLEVDGKREG
jgi:anti-sigma regulatory factor (Ser/Thr protein kinase)